MADIRATPGARRSALLRGLLRACHPEPGATVTAVVGLLALAAGRGWGTLWVVATIGAGQLAVGWSNDYLDRERDRAADRTDKPVAGGELPATVARNAAAGALVASVACSLALGPAAALVNLAGLAGALAYNAGLKVRPLSVLPYAIDFGLLPVFVTLGLPSPRWPAAWAPLAGVLLGVGGHFAQVLPDIAEDRRQGLRGLPQLAGERASAAVAAVALLAATVTITFGPGRPGPASLGALAIAAIGTLAIGAAVAKERPRLAFRLTLGIAAVAVLALVAGGRSL